MNLKEFPEIMRGAKEDLSANVAGRFSPEDWERILLLAREKYESGLASATGGREAWHAVVLEFYRSRYWGFAPDYRPPPAPKRPGNLGVRFMWITFSCFTLTNMALAWTGQNYTKSGSRTDLFILLGVIALVIGNIGLFLWQYRNYQD